VTRHAEEVKALKLQHEKTVKDLKARADQQAQESLQRMKEVEQRRMQEGGDWTKEMENALHREQEAVRRTSSALHANGFSSNVCLFAFKHFSPICRRKECTLPT